MKVVRRVVETREVSWPQRNRIRICKRCVKQRPTKDWCYHLDLEKKGERSTGHGLHSIRAIKNCEGRQRIVSSERSHGTGGKDTVMGSTWRKQTSLFDFQFFGCN